MATPLPPARRALATKEPSANGSPLDLSLTPLAPPSLRPPDAALKERTGFGADWTEARKPSWASAMALNQVFN
jgi:hypothetical protein